MVKLSVYALEILHEMHSPIHGLKVKIFSSCFRSMQRYCKILPPDEDQFRQPLFEISNQDLSRASNLLTHVFSFSFIFSLVFLLVSLYPLYSHFVLLSPLLVKKMLSHCWFLVYMELEATLCRIVGLIVICSLPCYAN